MLMALSLDEKALLESSGTKLQLIATPLGRDKFEGLCLPPRLLEEMTKGQYLRIAECGFLLGNVCRIHEDSKRPWVCQTLDSGSHCCLDTIAFQRLNH